MRGLTRYLSFEMIAIHLLTGALFAVITGVVMVAVVRANVWFALALVPLAAFSWWGWWAEARFVVRASSEMRRYAEKS